jgi:hypothetical protein
VYMTSFSYPRPACGGGGPEGVGGGLFIAFARPAKKYPLRHVVTPPPFMRGEDRDRAAFAAQVPATPMFFCLGRVLVKALPYTQNAERLSFACLWPSMDASLRCASAIDRPKQAASPMEPQREERRLNPPELAPANSRKASRLIEAVKVLKRSAL